MCVGTVLLSLLSQGPTLQVPCEPGSASSGLDLLCPALSQHAPEGFMPSKLCSRDESLFRRPAGLGGAARLLSRGCSAVSVAV